MNYRHLHVNNKYKFVQMLRKVKKGNQIYHVLNIE